MIRARKLAGYLAKKTGIEKERFFINAEEYETLRLVESNVFNLDRRYNATVYINECHVIKEVVPLEVYLKRWINGKKNSGEEFKMLTEEKLTDNTGIMAIECKFFEEVTLKKATAKELADPDLADLIVEIDKIKYLQVERESPIGI